jgi:hypothetical protein
MDPTLVCRYESLVCGNAAFKMCKMYILLAYTFVMYKNSKGEIWALKNFSLESFITQRSVAFHAAKSHMCSCISPKRLKGTRNIC